jgi:hypothetical protein
MSLSFVTYVLPTAFWSSNSDVVIQYTVRFINSASILSNTYSTATEAWSQILYIVWQHSLTIRWQDATRSAAVNIRQCWLNGSYNQKAKYYKTTAETNLFSFTTAAYETYLILRTLSLFRSYYSSFACIVSYSDLNEEFVVSDSPKQYVEVHFLSHNKYTMFLL